MKVVARLMRAPVIGEGGTATSLNNETQRLSHSHKDSGMTQKSHPKI